MAGDSVWLWAAFLGLLVGSFANVVIHRLPRMMQRQWDQEARQWLSGQDNDGNRDADPTACESPYNLARPASHCPACGHRLTWPEKLPVLGYMLLRGHCSACGAAIGWRYLAVELCVAALFAACAWRWGVTPQALAWALFAATLLVLACIDWDTQLLPDDLTLPLLWAGLIAAALGWTDLDLSDSLWGAVAGYLLLWIIHQGFKVITGKQGMGQGDFKLLAALGAWLGWPALLPLVLLSSSAGVLVGLSLRAAGRLEPGEPLPFGPALSAAGLFLMFWPERIGPGLWF
jgi:leader peptidase (prepilin peptidase)/N-methyltransferase